MAVTRLSRAEAKARTRDELVDAAERLFTTHGFHATALDQVAAEAGYTKGAVYSNFASKEDLFFAVYERRVERALERFAVLEDDLADDVPERLARATLAESQAGWLAVFFEFWAHVLRNPQLRERFAELHRRGRAPQVAWAARWLENRGIELEMGADRWTAAMFAVVTGLGLEQLTEPGLDGGAVAAEILALTKRGMT